MDNSLVNLINVILLIVFIISLFLQTYLSKRKDKISGLILPTIYFLRSFRSVLELWGRDISTGEILFIVLLQNIATIIFIVIFILCKKKIKRNEEIEKMNIQDLK